MNSKRAFVTGASGFLGWQIARQLVAQGTHVKALCRSPELPAHLQELEVEPVIGNLADPELLQSAVDGCDYVFHVAASVAMWRGQWAQNVATNVSGTRHVVQACLAAEIGRLVFTSTAATIGKPLRQSATASPRPCDESDRYNLESLGMVYPHTKWLAECEVQQGAAAGLDTVITHPAAVFGPGDWKRNTLPLFRGSRRGLGIFFPRGHRSVCDVRDVAQGHLLAAERGAKGSNYILAGETITVEQLFEGIAKEVDGIAPIFALPDRVVHGIGRISDALAALRNQAPSLSWEMAFQSTRRVALRSDKAERELGYKSRTAAESLADAARWFKEQGDI